MSTAELVALREELLRGQAALEQYPGGKYVLELEPGQLEYFANLLRSHIAWRRWLVPEDG